VQEQREFFQAE
jgi:U3 small nucleolar RNA-associated protein 7